MILELFSFFTGCILLLLTLIILIRNRQGEKLNVFFLILLGIAGSQRLALGLDGFGVIELANNQFNINLKFTFFLYPIYYAFFCTLFNKELTLKRVLITFGIAIAIALFLFLVDFGRDIKQIIYAIYSSIYVVLIGYTNRNVILAKKTTEEIKHFKSIKKWALILFGMFLLIYVFSNYIFYNYLYDSSYVVLKQFYTTTSILWFLIAVYILMNPLILYGKQLLKKELNSQSIDEIEVWKKYKVKVVENGDKKLEEKIKPHVNTLLMSLINYENALLQNFNKLPTLKELSFQLDCPQSHIKYLFKYYSHYSFSEYHNVLKIKYALYLINSQYLLHHTLDSLSVKCFFNSRSTFFKNFKKLLGNSPSEYILLRTTK